MQLLQQSKLQIKERDESIEKLKQEVHPDIYLMECRGLELRLCDLGQIIRRDQRLNTMQEELSNNGSAKSRKEGNEQQQREQIQFLKTKVRTHGRPHTTYDMSSSSKIRTLQEEKGNLYKRLEGLSKKIQQAKQARKKKESSRE